MTETGLENSIGHVLLYRVSIKIVDQLKVDLLMRQVDVIVSDDYEETVQLIKDHGTDILLAEYSSESSATVELLLHLKEKHPSVNRFIVLDPDYQEEAMALLLKGTITKYFEKPFGFEAMTKRIHHVLESKRILTNQKLLNLIHSIGELPVIHKTYTDFIEAIENNSPTKMISKILSRDISISTKILQIANSAFFKIKKIGSIERACIYLGLDTIKSIVFTATISTIRKLTKIQQQHLDQIIDHSLKVNNQFQRIYRTETQQALPELYSSVGLTHDIGQIIMLQYLPKRFMEIIDYQKKNPGIDFYNCEMALGYEGLSHCEIGAYFLDHWNFPEVNTTTALYHHRPGNAEESEQPLQEIFNFANRFVERG